MIEDFPIAPGFPIGPLKDDDQYSFAVALLHFMKNNALRPHILDLFKKVRPGTTDEEIIRYKEKVIINLQEEIKAYEDRTGAYYTIAMTKIPARPNDN